MLQTVKFKSGANQLGRTKCTVHAILKSNSVVCSYSNDIGMTFILEQVHFISMYFSVFVYTIPNLGIVLAPDCTICDFQSGTQFGMTKQTSELSSRLKIANRAVWGKWRTVYVCLIIENHMSENALFEPVDFII